MCFNKYDEVMVCEYKKQTRVKDRNRIKSQQNSWKWTRQEWVRKPKIITCSNFEAFFLQKWVTTASSSPKSSIISGSIRSQRDTSAERPPTRCPWPGEDGHTSDDFMEVNQGNGPKNFRYKALGGSIVELSSFGKRMKRDEKGLALFSNAVVIGEC